MSKQTAVQLLKDVLNAAYLDKKNKEYTDILFNHALQMEREQMEKAVSNAISKADMTNNRGYFNFDKWYNETYGVKGRENKTVVEKDKVIRVAPKLGEWGC